MWIRSYSAFLLCPFFFFNDTATTEIYTLSLHDALPICKSKHSAMLRNKETRHRMFIGLLNTTRKHSVPRFFVDRKSGSAGMPRPISYAVFCLKKKKKRKAMEGLRSHHHGNTDRSLRDAL